MHTFNRGIFAVASICAAALTLTACNDGEAGRAVANTFTSATASAKPSTTLSVMPASGSSSQSVATSVQASKSELRIAARTVSGNGVSGVTVELVRTSGCPGDVPDPNETKDIVGSMQTGPEGFVSFDVEPGCYLVGVTAVPLGHLPEPHGMHTVEITGGGQTINSVITFYDHDSPAMGTSSSGIITLLAEESGLPLAGETIWVSFCGGGNPGFYTAETDANGQVNVPVPGLECLEFSGLSNGPSGCSLVEQGVDLPQLNNNFVLTLHGTHPDAGVC